MNERLGRGVNMGNSFEAPSETAWGNPWDPEYFRIMSELGFDHVRLPVRWEPEDRSMASSPYTINPVFMERIQQVVDTALRYGLHIIVNMHHHEALYEDPAGQKERFLSMWNQISNHFKDYPDSLLFEVLNEPHGNLTPALWNEYFAGALAEIRKSNPTRMVLLGVAEYGGLGGIVHLQVPDDEYIIVSPHYYNPFNFTHQGATWVGPQADDWLGTKWYDTEADRETVESEFAYALQFSESNKVPLHIGEFGANENADLSSRVRWTTFLTRWFEGQNMSWAYWEFSAGFGIYDPVTKQFIDPLVDALLHNEMPEPTPVEVIPVYTSNFSSGTDGWVLNTQGGAAGSLTASSGELNVTITSGGTESWHVQVVNNNVPFENNKMYRLSFNVRAAVGRSATFYAGRASDPWNAYSGYKGISIGASGATYSFTFTMNDPTDMSARLVFDLGLDTTDVIISEVKVDELKILFTSVEEKNPEPEITCYPNPVTTILHCNELGRYRRVEVYDMAGRLWLKKDVNSGSTQIDLGEIPRGVFLLSLTGNGLYDYIKIIKE